MKNSTVIIVSLIILLGSFFLFNKYNNSKAQISGKTPQIETIRQNMFSALIEKADRQGSIQVIIGLSTTFEPEGLLSKKDKNEQRLKISQTQNGFLGRYNSLRSDEVKRFQYIPYLAFRTDSENLKRMQIDPSVASIQEDEIADAGLAESTQIVGAPTAWNSGYTGSGRKVAILDSGVDKNHSFFGGRVISEACYSSNVSGNSTSVCPAGATSSTEPDSGLHCSFSGCAHGTNVAGIAAGSGGSFSGVAKEADIIAIQMFSQFTCNGSPCARYWTSDLIRALERVKTLSETMNNIVAVNLSLVTNQFFQSHCDVQHSATKAAIDNLRSVGIATIICSGNDSFTNGLTAPACISSSISVGSVDDGSSGTTANSVSNFSNSSERLHLLAPGRWINSSIPGNIFQNYSGTSMAAPHVTGSFAILKQKQPNATIEKILNALVDSGQPITDSRNNIVKPRINIPAAIQNISNNTRFDLDGDRKTDIGIFRPGPGQWWYLRSSDNSNRAFQFGTGSDQRVPADFTGDGKTDVAFWRPSNGFWFVLRSEDNSFFSFPFGANGDIPAPGDFDGDGKDEPAVFRPSNATWYYVRSSDQQFVILQFGLTGDIPIVEDYDGDGKDDIALWRPSVSEWYLNRSTAGFIGFRFGAPNDTQPTPADFTGDGKADIAFFRSNAPAGVNNWFILRSEDNSFYAYPFGQNGDIPVPGDYDGDGTADSAVFRRSNNIWYLQQSTAGFTAIQFGIENDKPIPSSYIPNG